MTAIQEPARHNDLSIYERHAGQWWDPRSRWFRSLHRVNDLPGALVQIRRALQPDGLFMAALLGAGALIELRQVLVEAEAETEGGASPRVSPFGDVRDYGALLQRAGFALPVADSETLSLSYASPREVMREVRALGGGNVLLARSRKPLARSPAASPARGPLAPPSLGSDPSRPGFSVSAGMS